MKNPIKNIKRSTLIILVLAVAFVLISLPIFFTPSVTFCRLCHGREYKNRQSSSHHDVSCNACHRRPDFFAFVTYRLTILRMTGNVLTGFYDRPVRADVSSEACRVCHQREETKTLVVKGIRISHKELLNAGYECTYCHSTVVHGKLVPSPREVDMDKCLSCHDGERASAECEECHPSGTRRVRGVAKVAKDPWQITHGDKRRELHGMGNMAYCNLCHKPNFCARCHKVDLPHPESWLNVHGDQAKQNRKNCLSCHKEKLCDNCHKIAMPHPHSFLPEHAKETKRLGKGFCLKCHLEQGCDNCHTAHIHRGLSPDRLEKLKRESGL